MKLSVHRWTLTVGFTMLAAGLAHAIDHDRAAGMMPSDPPYLRGGQQEIGHTVEGEVTRIDGNYYFVEEPSGNEVRLIVNESTLRTGPITQGERIEARVNNENHALSIRPVKEAGPAQGDAGPTNRGEK